MSHSTSQLSERVTLDVEPKKNSIRAKRSCLHTQYIRNEIDVKLDLKVLCKLYKLYKNCIN